jgi:hypothetical protein
MNRLLALLALIVASAAGAQSPPPFGPGEKLEYAGRAPHGLSARGTFWIEGPVELRGTATWMLHSDMVGSFGFLHGNDKAVSWLDPVRMTSLRYSSHERRLLRHNEDVVDMFPDERRWTSEGGGTGTLATEAPLDELSFLYLLRTIALPNDSTLTFNRHYDTARNPTTVTVVGRMDVDVPAGRFHAVIVEMHVRDTKHYRGEGLIRIALSDDTCRLLLRLESDVPDAGKASLSLTAYSGTRCPAM